MIDHPYSSVHIMCRCACVRDFVLEGGMLASGLKREFGKLNPNFSLYGSHNKVIPGEISARALKMGIGSKVNG